MQEHDRVAVRAGRKVSKTTAGVAAAIWWAMRGGKVMFTAAAHATLVDPVWIELARLAPRVGLSVPLAPTTPIRTPSGGRIVGRQAARAENLQGPSGAESLYVIEEASGVRREIVEAIEGNVAGGGKILMLGNPTQLSGAYYDAFHREKNAWHTIHLSSRDSPNVKAGRVIIPGLAVSSWIEQMEAKHGKDSPFVSIHVDGEFPTSGANSVIPLSLINEAQERWHASKPVGRLSIGVDVARSGDDESVIQPVRGYHAFAPTALRDQTGPSLGAHALETANELREGDESVTINVDVIGVGASVFDWLNEHAPSWVIVNGINVAERATSDDEKHGTGPRYHRLRDQLAFGIRHWLEEGGSLPPSDEQRADLAALTFRFDANGRYHVASKDELREMLGRSPDHGDALGLALYAPPPPFNPAPPLGWE